MGSAAVKVLGMHAFLVEQGFAKEPPVVFGDSSSALQSATRTGGVCFQHVSDRLLVIIQSWVAAERLRLQKVQSAENVADVLTKHRIQRYSSEIVCGFESESNGLS